MKHIALFSQTGTEIVDLIRSGVVPDVVIHNHKLSSTHTINRDLARLCSYRLFSLPYEHSKDVKALRAMLGDPKECYITLHGWLSIVPKEICEEYDIYNGHPGLITEFECLKGKDPQVKAFNGKYSRIGSVIHHVTPGVDEGIVVFSHGIENKCTTLDEMFSVLKSISLNLWLDFFNKR